jgi:hypothetical protein
MTKFEIYLPLKHNDGTDIEAEKLEEIQQQLMAVFGALTVSSLSAPLQGKWRYGGVEYLDEIYRVDIVARDEWDSIQFFKNFKRRLKRSLRQLDILITVQYVHTI